MAKDETTCRPFIAAYHVLKVLEEEGAIDPSVQMYKTGHAILCLSYRDYRKFKELAEQLLLSKEWFTDQFNNCWLISREGLKE